MKKFLLKFVLNTVVGVSFIILFFICVVITAILTEMIGAHIFWVLPLLFIIKLVIDSRKKNGTTL